MESIHKTKWKPLTYFLFGFACLLLFFIYLNKPKEIISQGETIFAKESITETKPSTKEIVVLSDEKPLSTETVYKDSLPELNRIKIDPVIFKESFEAIYKKDINELIRLANAYPDEIILQYLVLNNCSYNNDTHCDLEQFSERLLLLEPNNTVSKSFLASSHIKKQDLISALDSLEKIHPSDSFNTYIPEFLDAASISTKQLMLETNFKLPDESFEENKEAVIDAFSMGIVSAQLHSTKLINSCKNESKTNSQKERWQDACINYAISMKNSSSLIDKKIAVELQKDILATANRTDGLDDLLSIEFELNELQAVTNQIIGSNEAFLSKDGRIYMNDFKKYGELEAMRRLVDRHKDDTPK